MAGIAEPLQIAPKAWGMSNKSHGLRTLIPLLRNRRPWLRHHMWGMIVSVTSVAALLLLSSVVFSQNVTIRPSIIAEGKVLCNPDVYGLDPQESSCLNAWSKIPRTASETVYGHRGLPGVVVIPVRYQSDDGLCVVELRSRQQRRAVRGDVTTGIEISDAVRRVIDGCVASPKFRSGGTTSDFSVLFLCFSHAPQEATIAQIWLSFPLSLQSPVLINGIIIQVPIANSQCPSVSTDPKPTASVSLARFPGPLPAWKLCRRCPPATGTTNS